MSESLPEPTKASNTLCGNAMESSKQDGEDRAAGVKQMHIDRPRNFSRMVHSSIWFFGDTRRARLVRGQ